MDSENQRLARLLFKNETQDTILDLIQNPEFSKYVEKIGSFSTEDLNREPIRLRNEKNQILEKTQEMAFKNYKTFIETADSSRQILNKFQNFEKNLNSLVEKIPKLEEKCQDFGKVTSEINNSRKLNSIILKKNAKLLEILELAQLMEFFIKEEEFENALELANYVSRLSSKYPKIQIFQSLTAEIQKFWLIMEQKLIENLRKEINLPTCLEIVGFLRRMDIFTEAELRLKFLLARDCWFKKNLAAVSNIQSQQRLTKTIELTRVCLFSITTQYRAIFNDDEHGISNFTSDKKFNENVIFHSWLHNEIKYFTETLKVELENETYSIDTILSQCMYFGLSMSRIGCDFRALMIPIFVHAVCQRFERVISKATREFERNMEKFTLINKKAPGNLYRSEKSTDENPLAPPENLLEFYPLAEYCNRVLTSFNELKLCAPYATIRKIVEMLQNSLVVVSRTILNFYGEEHQAFNQTAKEAFLRLCLCLTGDLVPYFQKCLQVLFSPSAVSAHLGISVQTINKSGILTLNKVPIADPIAHLLPTITTTKVELIAADEEKSEEENLKESTDENSEKSGNVSENTAL